MKKYNEGCKVMLSDGVKVEKEVTEPVAVPGAEMAPEAPKDPKDMTPEEKAIAAVQYLTTAIPAARSLVNDLTGVQAKRVLTALIEAPLEETKPNFTTKGAHQLYNLACIIQNAKYVLFQNAPSVMSEVEKAAAEEQARKEAEQENSETKEGN